MCVCFYISALLLLISLLLFTQCHQAALPAAPQRRVSQVDEERKKHEVHLRAYKR